jgi:response regulator NasT
MAESTLRRVAIIDDDESQRVVLGGFVEDMGHEVVALGKDGADAVAICREHSPDILIMDIRMPGVDGIEAAALVSAEVPTPMVLVTANPIGYADTAPADSDCELARAVSAGVMGLLSKPLREEDLYSAIELAITRFNETRALRGENSKLKNAMEDRKVIEKAKGLLMESEGLKENEAFARIRKISMDKRSTMREVSDILIMALGKGVV